MRAARHKIEESGKDPIDEQIAKLRKIHRHAPVKRLSKLGTLVVFGPFVGLLTNLLTNSIDDRDSAAVRSLASQRDLRSLGCLLSFYNIGNRHVRDTVEAAMLEMLPRAREADGLRFEAGDRVALHKLLNSRAEEIALVALNSLQYIGDSTSIPHLMGIVSGKRIPRSLSYHREKIQAQAAKTIDSINQRTSGLKAHDSLLRSAAPEHPNSGHLVTPAQEPGRTAANELLRPDTGNDADKTGS